MGWDEWQGILRAVIPSVLAYAAAAGWIGSGDIPGITTAVITIGAAIWSVMHKKQLKVQGA